MGTLALDAYTEQRTFPLAIQIYTHIPYCHIPYSIVSIVFIPFFTCHVISVKQFKVGMSQADLQDLDRGRYTHFSTDWDLQF